MFTIRDVSISVSHNISNQQNQDKSDDVQEQIKKIDSKIHDLTLRIESIESNPSGDNSQDKMDIRNMYILIGNLFDNKFMLENKSCCGMSTQKILNKSDYMSKKHSITLEIEKIKSKISSLLETIEEIQVKPSSNLACDDMAITNLQKLISELIDKKISLKTRLNNLF